MSRLCNSCGQTLPELRRCMAEVAATTYRERTQQCSRPAARGRLYCAIHEKMGREGRRKAWRGEKH